MSGIKLKELPDAGVLDDGDFLLMEQRTGTKKVTVGNINKKSNEAIALIGSQLEDMVKTSDSTKEDINMTKIHKRLTDDTLKNRQYVMVGDSLRDANGHFNFKTLAYKLIEIGVEPILHARSGLNTAHWSKTNINQTGFFTVDDTIKLIKGNGSETVVDICLGTNDIAVGAEDLIKQYLINGINAIRTAKPDVLICLQTPNRFNLDEGTNNIVWEGVTRAVTQLGDVGFIDIMKNVFKTREDTIPYLIDSQHPNEMGQRKIGKYNLSKILPNVSTKKNELDFNEINLVNPTGGVTTIKYAINNDFFKSGDSFSFKKDYLSSWVFYVVNGSTEIRASKLIDGNGIYPIRQQDITDRAIYGFIEVEGFSNLATYNKTSCNLLKPIKSIIKSSTNTVFSGELNPLDKNFNLFKTLGIKCNLKLKSGTMPSKLYIVKVANELSFSKSVVGDSYDFNTIPTYLKGKYSLSKIGWGSIDGEIYLDIKNPTELTNIPNGSVCEIINFASNDKLLEIENIIECNQLNFLSQLKSIKFNKLQGSPDKLDENYSSIKNTNIRLEVKYTDNVAGLDECWFEKNGTWLYLYSSKTGDTAFGAINKISAGYNAITAGFTSNNATGSIYMDTSIEVNALVAGKRIKFKNIKVNVFNEEKTLWDLIVN